MNASVNKAFGYAGLRLVGQGAELVGWVFLARRVSVTAFGELTIAFLAARYVGLVADWGATLRGPRDVVEKNDAELHALLRTRNLASLILSVAFALICVLVGAVELAPMAVVALNRGVVRDWLALGREQPLRAGLPSTAQGIAFIGLALIVHSRSAAVATIAIAYGIGLVTSIAMNPAPASPSKRSPRPDGWALTIMLANQVLLSLDTGLIALLRNTADAGIYAGVYRLSTAITTSVWLVAGALIAPATKAMSEDSSRAAVVAAARRRGLVSGSLVVVLAPIAYAAVPTIFGSAFTPGRFAASLLIVAAGFGTAIAPLLAVHLGDGRDRAVAKSMVLLAAANTALNFIAIPTIGINGAAWTSVAAQACLLVYLLRTLPDRTGSAPAAEQNRTSSANDDQRIER